jgi:serine/threonine-protein kinase
VRLCATDGSGGFWEAGDTLLFSGGRGHGLLRVAASGGTPRAVTTLDAAQGETTHTYPWPLPDGGLLFTALTSRGADALTVVQDAKSGARRTLFPGFDARVMPGGYLVYTFSRAVRAVRFDLRRHQTVDAPVTLVEHVTTYTLYPIAVADASANGTLIYAPRDQAPRRLLWVDPTGERPLPIQAGLYETPRLSPSGERVAVKLDDDIWVIDLRRPTLTRLTVAPGWNDTPAWTPDGRRIAYGCHRRGVYHGVCWLPADGSGTEEELFARPNYASVAGFSPDGGTLLFLDNTMDTGHDVGTYTLSDRTVRPLLASAFNERSPAVSPDGRWIAYSSDDSGSRQVYVQPFPALGARWQASTDGGDEPVWSRDGRQLFYRRKDDMVAVAVSGTPEFQAGLPHTLFSGRYLAFVQRPDTDYDVAPDGRRFLVVKREGTQEAPLVMIVDWAEELRRRLPWTPVSP